MGWDRRRYYTRLKKVNGRDIREYVGTDRVAELVAQMDGREPEKRQLRALDLRQANAELASLDAELKALTEETDRLARAAMLGGGALAALGCE
jgi:hypothetical protein